MRPLSRCLFGVKWAIYILGFKNPSQILVLISYITVRYKRGEGGAPPYFANPKEVVYRRRPLLLPHAKYVKLDFAPSPPEIEPRFVAWQSIKQPLLHITAIRLK